MTAATRVCMRVVVGLVLHHFEACGKALQASSGCRHRKALVLAAVRKSHADGVDVTRDLCGPMSPDINKRVNLISPDVTFVHNVNETGVGGGPTSEKHQKYHAHCIAVTCLIRIGSGICARNSLRKSIVSGHAHCIGITCFINARAQAICELSC